MISLFKGDRIFVHDHLQSVMAASYHQEALTPSLCAIIVSFCRVNSVSKNSLPFLTELSLNNHGTAWRRNESNSVVLSGQKTCFSKPFQRKIFYFHPVTSSLRPEHQSYHSEMITCWKSCQPFVCRHFHCHVQLVGGQKTFFKNLVQLEESNALSL